MRVAASTPARRIRVRRFPERARYERAALDPILDAGLLCHVGFVFEGSPVVIPTLYWREADHVYWHGSTASRMLRALPGCEVCITVTHLDGLVLTRSAFHHSVNYRSAVLFGRAENVEDPKERLAQLERMTETLFPGRWPQLRPVKHRELGATRVLRLRIGEFSVKSRSGPPQEDARDLKWPVWAGVIPLALRAGLPQPDEVARASKASGPAFRKLKE